MTCTSGLRCHSSALLRARPAPRFCSRHLQKREVDPANEKCTAVTTRQTPGLHTAPKVAQGSNGGDCLKVVSRQCTSRWRDRLRVFASGQVADSKNGKQSVPMKIPIRHSAGHQSDRARQAVQGHGLVVPGRWEWSAKTLFSCSLHWEGLLRVFANRQLGAHYYSTPHPRHGGYIASALLSHSTGKFLVSGQQRWFQH